MIGRVIIEMDEKISMRDAFFNRLYNIAKEDRNVILVSADMGAPSLDKFRKDLKSQYVDTGIAEQNSFLIASGLALSGKKPFVYAITPFVTTRTHEFAKLELGLMGIPITILGIGAGYSYDDSGPTHHTVEDISIMRVIPKMVILNPSDSVMSEKLVDKTINLKAPSYVRFDRKVQKIKYDSSENFEKGFKELKPGENIGLAATGNMVDIALDIAKQYPEGEIGVIDLYQLKPLNPEIKDSFIKYKKIISLEEHLLAGGFGSMIAEFIMDHDLPLKLRRVGVNDQYNYEYGGRDYIQDKMGIGRDSIIDKINSIK